MVLSELTVAIVLAGVAGGMLGAAFGAVPALSLAGIALVAGEIAGLGVSPGIEALEPFGVSAATVDGVGFGAAVGLGPVLGPHVAFAGGVAAAAYAGRKETFDTTFRFHQAKQISKPLGSDPATLLVGGVFGAIGVVLARIASGAGLPLDPIAFAVVVSALIHRLALGYPLLGRITERDGSILDMSPFEQGLYWGDADNETAQGTAGRHVVEPWQPEHYEWDNVAVLGFGVGLGAGVISLTTESAFLPFGIALASLLFYAAGRYSLPVTHHMALPAGVVALAYGLNGEPLVALALAGVFGVLGGVLGELAQRVVYAHADTHFAPSFVSILLTSLLIAVLGSAGVLDGSLPYPTL